METTDLALFLAITESQSISGAAERLHTVQSNVSTRLRALEHRVGAQLFHRHARGVTLSGAGEIFLPYARRIVRLMQESVNVIADADDPVGHLALGSMETTAGWRLPELLADFAEDCPRVDVSLRTGPTDDLVRDVLDHRLDGAFVAGPVGAHTLEERTVFVEELVLVSSRRRAQPSWSARAGTASETRRDEEGTRMRLLVFREGCRYRKNLVSLTTSPEGVVPSLVEFGSLEGILGCVAAGMGVTLLPANVVRTSALRKHLRIQPLPEGQGRAETIFVRRADAPLGPAMMRFLERIDIVVAPPGLHSVSTTA
ncbi:LysR substrate-binding domain-containing protein [Amycolatopsis sp. TRM77291]